MIDSIYVAMTGLLGYQRGLRLISDNTANLNTPGFKGSGLLFSDLVLARGLSHGGRGAQFGNGLTTLGTVLDFKPGQYQNTGNLLDLSVAGEGFFVLRDEAGNYCYTRDGQFKFDADGVLVSTATGKQVMAFDDGGALGEIRTGGLMTDAAIATTSVQLRGNLDSAGTTTTVNGVALIDRSGATRNMKLRLDAVSGNAGTWNVTLLDGATTVGTGQIRFINGVIDLSASTVSIAYSPVGQTPMTIAFDFGTGVTSFASGGPNSTLAVASQDGRAAGELTGTTFDASGALVLTYSNGRTVNGVRLALGRFGSQDDVRALGASEFEAVNPGGWRRGLAQVDGFGKVQGGVLEMSNVDLSREFSNLVIMQRGYQASSQVVSTANEMLSELFGLRGRG